MERWKEGGWTWYISRKYLWICHRRMSKILVNQDYLCPGRISHVCALCFIPFFKKLRFEHRVVTLSAVGVVLADYNNYSLLTGADVFEQQQLNSMGKPKWGALQWSLTFYLPHCVHGAQVLLRTAWRPPSADATGVYLPSYPLPKAYITCGRGWTRIPSKRAAHIALISLQHFQQLRQEYSSSFCYDYIHHAAYVSVKNRDWYTSTWLMIISCRGRTVNVCT